MLPIETTARQFLMQHGLDRPDGRSLYAYRLPDDGYAMLRALVAREAAGASIGVGASHSLGSLFCLFVAEWYRREFREGAWSWDGPCAAVRIEKDFSALHALVQSGLGYWRQPVLRGPDGSREYLASLVVQGGIPTAFAARGQGWLSDFLRAAMRDLEAGGDLSDEAAQRHARFHDHRVPQSFRVPAFVELVGRLAARLADLRRRAHDLAGGVDLVAWLDGTQPGWSDDLPIAMADEAARGLIEGLVRQRPEPMTGAPVAAERLLLCDGDGSYRFGVRLLLDGRLDLHTHLAGEAMADLAGRSRARLFPSGLLADRIAGCLSILEPAMPDVGGADDKTGRTNPRRPWLSRGVPSEARRVVAPFPPDADVEVRLHADDRDLATLVLPAGGRLLDGVLSFRAVGTENPARELRLIGSGSVRTREPQLFVAVPEAADLVCEVGTANPVAFFEGRRLYRLAGRARVTTPDGDVCRLTTSSEDESAVRLEASGVAPDDMEAAVPLFRGLPAIRLLRPGGLITQAPVSQLRWRPVGIGAPWLPLAGGPTLIGTMVGLVEIAMFEGDVIQDRLRLGLLPPEAHVRRPRPLRDAAAVILAGLGDATVEPKPRDPRIGVRQEADLSFGGIRIEVRAGTPLPRRLPVEIRFRDRAALEVRVPIVGSEVAFFGTDGQRLRERSEIGISDLRGLTIEASGAGRVIGEVQARGMQGGTLRFARRFEGSLAAASLRSEIEALLAASDDLDATLRLTACVGASECRLDVRRYAFALEPGEGGVRVERRGARAWTERGEHGGSLVVVARRFSDLCGAETELTRLSPDDLALTTVSLDEIEGLALVYARRTADGIVVSRPLLARGTREIGRGEVEQQAPDVDPGRLRAAMLMPAWDEREVALRRCLTDLGKGRCPEAAEEILTLIRTFAGQLPFQTFDVLRQVGARPAAMVEVLAHAQEEDVAPLLAIEEELPFSWVTSPLFAWMEAFDRRRARLETALAVAISDPTRRREIATGDAVEILERVAALVPSLASHAQIAAFRLGAPLAGSPFGASLPERELSHRVKTLASTCIGRNQGRNDWPRQARFRDFEGLAAELPPEPTEFHDIMTPMLDAPYAAAALAFERIRRDPGIEQRLRVCRFFDPAYFEQAFSHAVTRLWARVNAT